MNASDILTNSETFGVVEGQSFMNLVKIFFVGLLQFLNNPAIIVLMLFVGIFYVLNKASKNPTSPIHWHHLIIDSKTNRSSAYKLGYIIGVVVSTWIVLTLATKGTLSYDVLGIYLSYLIGGVFIQSKDKRAPSHVSARSADYAYYEEPYDNTENYEHYNASEYADFVGPRREGEATVHYATANDRRDSHRYPQDT